MLSNRRKQYYCLFIPNENVQLQPRLYQILCKKRNLSIKSMHDTNVLDVAMVSLNSTRRVYSALKRRIFSTLRKTYFGFGKIIIETIIYDDSPSPSGKSVINIHVLSCKYNKNINNKIYRTKPKNWFSFFTRILWTQNGIWFLTRNVIFSFSIHKLNQ